MSSQRSDLIQRVMTLKDEIDQIFIDTEYWNDNVRMADEESIDPDPDGILRMLREGLIKCLKNEIRAVE